MTAELSVWARVMLSTQRALLGKVTPNLRLVAVRWDEQEIVGRFVYDVEEEDDLYRLQIAETEVVADFYPELEVRFALEVCAWPAMIDVPEEMVVAYARYEPAVDDPSGNGERQ
jgi:hypothetical protein